MNILVTGGAGFIGSHIVDEYIRLGHRVAIMDNFSTGRRVNVNPAARLYEVDIRDTAQVLRIFEQEKFDVLNHHAAQMDVRRSVEDPIYDASVNILGALSLLEACVKTGVRRVLFASSGGAIYGEQDVFPADETHPTRPVSPYGVAKLATEQYLFYYKHVHGVDFVSLRYANVYGPRQNPEGEAGVVAIFTTRMLRGQQPIINGDGKQTRDFVYVGDVVRANVLALKCEGSEVFNIGTGVETNVNQLFAYLRTATGSSCEEKHGPAKKGEQLRSVLSFARISGMLGWKPEVTIEDGLRRTVEYFRAVEGYGVAPND
ncbi:MAG TPA: NAD-dependent epimerase/dehydratase family protein [Bacteroidota bacterium]|nr:NAD-dependent epimerase/dehydratase family protein [Bacteroidota bacterium]